MYLVVVIEIYSLAGTSSICNSEGEEMQVVYNAFKARLCRSDRFLKKNKIKEICLVAKCLYIKPHVKIVNFLM